MTSNIHLDLQENRNQFEAHCTRLTYSTKELALALGVSRQWVHEQISAGTIVSIKIGGKRLIPVAAVDQLLAFAA